MALTVVELPHPVTLEGMAARREECGRVSNFAGAGVHAVLDGRLVPREEWDEPIPPGSVLVLRAKVSGEGEGGDSDPLRTVLQVALIAASVYVGGTAWFANLGTLSQGLVQAAIMVGGQLIINAIAPPSLPGSQDDREEQEPVYSLIGGANRTRPYQPLLLVMGTHRVFPDLGAREYTTFALASAPGAASIARDDEEEDFDAPDLPTVPEDRFPGGGGGGGGVARSPSGLAEQYLHQIFHFGLGDLDISELRIADTLLSDFDEVETQTAGDDGALDLFAGNVNTEAGGELRDTAWVTRQTSSDTTRVELDFQGRIVRVGEDGDRQSHSVALRIEMWPDGDEAAARRTTLTLTHARYEPLRQTVPFEDLDAGVWHVRVRRDAAPSEDDRVSDDVSWTAMRSFQPDEADYAGQRRMAVRIRASGQLHGRIDRLSGMVSQLIPAWDGSAWVERRATGNPAWIFRWYALGVRAAGELVAGVGLSEVDDAGLKRWGAWCHARGLECNFILERDMSHAEVLALIAQCGRASASWATGRLGVVWDEEDRPATFYFGPGNIIEGSMEIDWVSGPVAEEIALRYLEPDMDWQFNTVRRRVPGVPAGTANRTATITRQGVTSGEQAAKEANLQAARQVYHRRRIRWQTGPEGLSLARGQVGHLSHALVSGGSTGRVLGGTRSELLLSAPVALPAVRPPNRDQDWLLLRSPDGSLHSTAISRGAGSDDPDETDRVALADPLPSDLDAGGSSPADTLWRHYPAGSPPLRIKLMSVEPQSSGDVALEAIVDVPAYYAAATSDLTIDLPPVRRHWPRVLGIQVSELLIRAGGGYAVELTASLTVDGDWTGGEVLASLDEGPERLVARLGEDEIDATWIVPVSGTLTIRAVPVSAAAPSGRSHSVEHEIRGTLAAPAAPAGFGLAAVAGGYVARWDPAPEIDYSHTEILDGPTDDAFDDATPRGEVSGTVFSRLGADAGAAVRVWARHVDQTGVAGPAVHADVIPQAAEGGASINWRGPWTASAEPPYADLDAVSHEGGSWVAAGAPDPATAPPGSTWDVLAASGSRPAHFRQAVVEVPIRAVGPSIPDASRFDPDPAEADLVLDAGDGRIVLVTVRRDVSAAGVADSLTGANAADFEIVKPT